MNDIGSGDKGRGPGRPPVAREDRYSRVLQLRLREWQDFYIGVLAERWGTGKTEVVRRLLEEELRREADDDAPALIEFFGRQAAEIQRRREAEELERDPDGWIAGQEAESERAIDERLARELGDAEEPDR
jgi:hypothetical protein